MTSPPHRTRRGTFFPIAEIYGFAPDATSDEAARGQRDKLCPFAGGACEKAIQYNLGYCSVNYAAEWDDRVPQPYAVCDHRLDGDPVAWAVRDHFQGRSATLVPEVTVVSKPKLNVDYVAYAADFNSPDGVDLIAIETQAIDLRGGGVGPAFRAWENGEPERWRNYFSEEAATKGRQDTVDYGVNMGNVYKRLGTQVAIKGQYLYEVSVPLYVVMQQRVLRQLRARVDFDEVTQSDEPWDITFAGFEYTGNRSLKGQLEVTRSSVVRTTLRAYVSAMSARSSQVRLRSDLIEKVMKKAGVKNAGIRGQNELPFDDFST